MTNSQILVIGEVLVDIFPQYERIGGAPFNFANHLHTFGFCTQFVSRIGDDTIGNKIDTFIIQKKLPAEQIQIDPIHPTGKVLVSLSKKGVPDFEIIKNSAYDFIEYSLAFKKILLSAKLLYIGSLAQRNQVSFHTIQKILSQQKNSLVLYDINLRAPHYSKKIIESTLTATSILKLNEDELFQLKEIFHLKGDKYLLTQTLMDQFQIDWGCVTLGENGSFLVHKGKIHETLKNSKSIKIIDTVGAGDAYSAILAIGILKKWPPKLILERAAKFSAAICEIEGAIPENESFYVPYKEWV